MKLSHKKPEGGFTLLEIMMVVIIIGLLAGTAVHFMGGTVGMAQEVRVKADAQTLSTSLKLYQATNGFLPSNEQGLKALTVKPTSEPRPSQWRMYQETILKDPWNQPYYYRVPGIHNPGSFDVFSAGKDLQPGTDDDIGNWESEPTN